MESRGSLDHQVGYVGWKNISFLNDCSSLPHEHVDNSVDSLTKPEDSNGKKPFPKLRSMKNQKNVVEDIEVVGEEKQLKVTSSSDYWK